MRSLSAIALTLLIFCACKREKYEAPAAYFLKSGTVDVTTTLTTQGSSSSKITDLWLYVNGKFQGAYPVGATLPIKSTGPTEIVIFPGIKNNGISATRQPYEFYAPIEIDTAVDTRLTFNRNLTFKYKTGAVFHWLEDFENFGNIGGITFTKSNISDTGFAILNNDPNVFQGSKCMYWALDGSNRLAQFQSNSMYSLPSGGAPVYLELNYKCDAPFEVGVYNGSDFRPILTVNTSSAWNKIYAQLSFGVSTQPSYSKFGVYIKAYNANPPDVPTFYIDNLKLISY